MSSASTLAELKAGLPIVVGALIGTGVGVASLPFFTAGAFIVPLEQSLGWTRTDLSIALAASTLALVVGGPISGRLADRFGTRWVATLSLCILALGFVAMSQMHGSAWIYVLVMGGASLLSAGSSPVTFTRAVNATFRRGRGLALGVTLLGMGIAGALGPVYADALITFYGWRTGFIGLAVVVLIAVPLVAWLVRDGTGNEPTNLPRRLCKSRAWLRNPILWKLGVGFFLVALAQSGPITHFIPMLIDDGQTPAAAARAAGALGGAVVVGTLITGWALDHVFAPLVAVVVFGLTGFGCLVMATGHDQTPVLMAIVLGFSLGADVDLLSYMTARYFGMDTYGEIYGYVYGAFSMGAAIGPILAGLAHDRAGSYSASLIGSAVVFAVACAVIGRTGRYPADG